MLSDEQVEMWATRLVQAHRDKTRAAADLTPPGTAEDAFRIQAGVARAMGAVGGFKTGLAAGRCPNMAPLFADLILDSGATLAVADTIGIELEIGFRIVAPLPDLSDVSLARCLRPVAVIELCDTRLHGPGADAPLVKLADNQINAGLVVGSGGDWSGDDFGAVQASLYAGDTVVLNGATQVPDGSALGTFRAFVTAMNGHCGGLQPGHIVITGSLHPPVWLGAGTPLRGQIERVGSVSVTLT